MQWQPTIQAGFCRQIKVFNYTQCFDKTALTSVALYEPDRNGNAQKDAVVYC